MINYDDVAKEETKKHNPNWPQIPDNPYKTLIIGGSVSEKTNSLFNLVIQQPDIDQIYLCAKDPYEVKHQFLIGKRESAGLNHFNDSKTFIKYSNDIDNIQKNIEEYNPNKKRKTFIIIDDMIADILCNKKLKSIVTELFTRARKLNIFLVFITQSYFAVLKNIRLNSTHYFTVKLPHKRELQQTGNFVIQIKNFEKGTKTLGKKCFLNNLGLLISTKGKFLDNFKSRLFPIKNLYYNTSINTKTINRTRSSNRTNKSNLMNH